MVELQTVKEHRDMLKKVQGASGFLPFPVEYIDWLIQEAEKTKRYKNTIHQINKVSEYPKDKNFEQQLLSVNVLTRGIVQEK